MLVRISRGLRTKARTIENLLSICSEDFAGHGMANVFSNANYMTKCLMKLQRIVRNHQACSKLATKYENAGGE